MRLLSYLCIELRGEISEIVGSSTYLNALGCIFLSTAFPSMCTWTLALPMLPAGTTQYSDVEFLL